MNQSLFVFGRLVVVFFSRTVEVSMEKHRTVVHLHVHNPIYISTSSFIASVNLVMLSFTMAFVSYYYESIVICVCVHYTN